MSKYVLGIDPGFSGALALVDPKTSTLVEVIDMPTFKVSSKAGSTKTEIAEPALCAWIAKHASEIRIAWIEDVHAMPDQGVSSTFRFGYGYGVLTGALAAFKIPGVKIRPSVWKMMMGLTRDKNLSRSLAIKVFPEKAELFKRKKDDGRAEAALLALLGTKKLYGGQNGSN